MSAIEVRSRCWLCVVLLALASSPAKAAEHAVQDCLVRVYLTRQSGHVLFEQTLLSGVTVHETSRFDGAVVDPRGFIACYAGDLSGQFEDSGTQILVETADGVRYPASVVGVDERVSLAVLHSEAARECELKSSRKQTGSRLLVVSSSETQWKTFSPKLVKAESSRLLPEDRLQVTNPGFQTDSCAGEGGFLFSEQGKLSGIITHIHAHPFSHKLAVLDVLPASIIEKSAQEVIERRSNLKAGWLGVYFMEGETPGVLVSKVVPGSPADQAGLQSGDLISRADRERIQNSRELARMIRWRGPEGEMDLRVVRRGRPHDLQVRLAERRMKPPTFALALQPQPGRTAQPPVEFQRTLLPLPLSLGLLMEASPDAALFAFPGVTPGGLRITSVLSGSSAEKAGFQPGDLILKVNGRPVLSLQDFLRLADSAQEALAVQYLRHGKVLENSLTLR